MAHHDIYLQIEPVAGYSPLAPIRCSRQYGRDCMRNPGHEIGRVNAQEIFSTTFDAVVYHRYQDAMYMNPVTDKLVAADVNEPPWDRRIPGCVLYADVGDELSIHVRNGDSDCHSFHLHGLKYGIDSDGAWPLGVQAADGRRSDQILPGESWTYRFRATPETVGVWAFHDHFQMVQRWANRGLFGMLIVREPKAPRCEHEIPLIVHELAGDIALDGFESPTLANGQAYAHTFGTTETNYPYHCKIHGPTMSGNVQVAAGAPNTASVVIVDNAFTPASIQVAPGGTLSWFNSGNHEHIVFAEGGGGSAFCLNGRSYVGNTPTIVAEAGQRLRWYLLNLDLNGIWHNVHTHAARWQIPVPPGGSIDVHSLSPTEGFTIDTDVPPPLLFLPDELAKLQEKHPPAACQVTIRGDFLFHCHIEEHMMQGLAGLVRAREQLWVTEAALKKLPFELPFDGADECSSVDGRRTCKPARKPEMPGMGQPEGHPIVVDPAEMIGVADMGGMAAMGAMAGMGSSSDPEAVLAAAAEQGAWELASCDSKTLAVHFALLHTGKLLIFSGSGNFPPRHDSHTYGSTVWDYQGGGFASPPISYDMFCGGQATLPNGDVLSAGGTQNYDSPWEGAREAAVFSTSGESWTNDASMADTRLPRRRHRRRLHRHKRRRRRPERDPRDLRPRRRNLDADNSPHRRQLAALPAPVPPPRRAHLLDRRLPRQPRHRSRDPRPRLHHDHARPRAVAPLEPRPVRQRAPTPRPRATLHDHRRPRRSRRNRQLRHRRPVHWQRHLHTNRGDALWPHPPQRRAAPRPHRLRQRRRPPRRIPTRPPVRDLRPPHRRLVRRRYGDRTKALPLSRRAAPRRARSDRRLQPRPRRRRTAHRDLPPSLPVPRPAPLRRKRPAATSL
jgi:FtsP/CotA-like multicopper oxidase with cupredoxin domain